MQQAHSKLPHHRHDGDFLLFRVSRDQSVIDMGHLAVVPDMRQACLT
jgi:hypothetical protein